LESIEFNDLPEFEDDEVVFKHLGYSKSSSQLYENFHKLVLLHFKLWQKHFEMLNLGCATYLTFYLFCKEKFQPKIERRKKIIDVVRRNRLPPALGKPPEVITKPFTIMLWGITKERIERWLSGAAGESAKQPTGMPASPGIAEGPARVVLSAEEIVKVKEGEILVTPITAPSWNPVFLKVKATVTDI